MQCWSLYLLAKTWNVRPSELLGLPRSSYEAYCLDEAIGFFGNNLKFELDKIEPPKKFKGDPRKYVEQKQKLLLHKTFRGELGGPKYADPAAKFEELEAKRARERGGE